MSWLDERTIKYRYKMEDGSIKHLELPVSEEAPKTRLFEHAIGRFATGTYDGFEPEVVEQINVVEFDKNGRKAVRITDKNGKVRYQSKSKLHWAKTGRIENKYTREYEEHLAKTKQEQLLRTEHSRKRATVSKASANDVLKNLPDGEYISDGTNVSIAPPGIADKKK